MHAIPPIRFKILVSRVSLLVSYRVIILLTQHTVTVTHSLKTMRLLSCFLEELSVTSRLAAGPDSRPTGIPCLPIYLSIVDAEGGSEPE